MKSIRVTVEIGLDYDEEECDEYEARDKVDTMLSRLDISYYNILDYQDE